MSARFYTVDERRARRAAAGAVLALVALIALIAVAAVVSAHGLLTAPPSPQPSAASSTWRCGAITVDLGRPVSTINATGRAEQRAAELCLQLGQAIKEMKNE